MTLRDEVMAVFGGSSPYEGTYVKFAINSGGWMEIKVGKMYEPPPLALQQLQALSDLFGTEWIDANGFARGGCETCDYGSDYGHVIELRHVTKRMDEFTAAAQEDARG